MAALTAADPNAQTGTNPIRDAVRAHVLARNPAVLGELRNFFLSHKRREAASDLQQYIAFALCVTDPPEFAMRYKPGDIPPEVTALEGFPALMQRFYKDADIESAWRGIQPSLDKVIAAYQPPVVQGVMEVNGYLRNPTSGYMGRRFQIFLDLLGPPNQIQSFSYGDEYFVVLTPSARPDTNEIRHAYLHYLLDPLSLKFSNFVDRVRGLGDFAKAAPALEDSYKQDFLLLATESLIKGIEVRLAKPAERSRMVQEALEDGFVLTPYFSEALPGYEKQEVAMRLYFPDLMENINLRKEDKRLEGIKFASARRAGKLVTPAQTKEPSLTPAQKTLDEAEKQLYSEKNIEKARETYMRALQETDDKTIHARAYYGLGRAAALERNPELAEKLFHKTLELTPDPQTKAWAQVYLGRLSDLAGEREQAAQFYQAVLANEGASAAARKAAEEGLKSKFQKN